MTRVWFDFRDEIGSPRWDMDSAGAESPEHAQQDYSKDPDYVERQSEGMQLSEEEYAEDSDAEVRDTACFAEPCTSKGKTIQTRGKFLPVSLIIPGWF